MQDQVLADGLTAVDWAIAAGVLAGALLLARLARSLSARRVARSDGSAAAAKVVGRLVSVAVVVAGLLYCLGVLGVRLGPLLGAIGIGGIAVALAAQSLLGDFIASVLLQIRRPFRIGDQILTNGYEGTVEDVNFRTVVLRSHDGERVYVPSSDVLSEVIVNHTTLRRRRTTLAVGVAYGTDLEQAQAVLIEAATAVSSVLGEPAVEAHVEAFNDSSIDFAVRFWHAPDMATMWATRSAVAMAVKRGLDNADITIPFPQRDVNFPGQD